MKVRILLLSVATSLAVAASSRAVPVIDGTADAEYEALSVQNTNTHFGNATTGDAINAGGASELDQVFAKVTGGRLYVLVAGNLETNFNKLEVFIDSEAGGVNTIVGEQLPHGVDGFCCGGFPPPDGDNAFNVGALQRMNGLTFDAGFEPDHYLTFMHGFENALDPPLRFYALTAHYADLTEGTSGQSGALGMQLAPYGLPRVLRGTTADFDIDGDADGDDFLRWQRNVAAIDANRLQGDATGDQFVDGADLEIWKNAYGFSQATATYGANYFAPQSAGIDNSEALLGPELNGLDQGDLIDKQYAFSPDGGATDNAGTGAVTRELEFVLPPVAETNNAASHRNMSNFVELQMAIDNSNTVGVTGDGPYFSPTDGNPGDVRTGLEFSIPLEHIGNPTGPIKITAFINGYFHSYASNQFSGEGILEPNLGGDGFGGDPGEMWGVNLNEWPGNQYVSVNVTAAQTIPEPAAAVLLALAVAGCYAGRRQGARAR